MGMIDQAQNRYTRFSTKTSEEFNTASRSVKPGLIASGIVSAWTWAATLLQSSSVAYTYGVAAPFWVHRDLAIPSKTRLSVLVCRGCDGTDPHVLHLGLQSQTERPKMPYLPRDHLHPIWSPHTLGLHLLRPPNKRPRQQSASLGRKCCGDFFDRHERLCCHLSHPPRSLCLCGIGRAAGDIPL